MEINVPLLDQIQTHIKANAEHFDMGTYFSYMGKHWEPMGPGQVLFDIVDGYVDLNSCGTTACLAGWATVLSKTASGFGWRESGRMALGLTNKQACELFYIENWPVDLKTAYNEAVDSKNYDEMAEVACEMIDWFVEKYSKAPA